MPAWSQSRLRTCRPASVVIDGGATSTSTQTSMSDWSSLISSISDLGIATVGERLGNSLRERWPVERGKDRPIRTGSVENALVGLQGIDHRRRKASVVEALFFREHRYVAVLEVNVLPTESLTALIALVAENLCSPNSRVREEIDESAVAAGLDCGLSVLTDVVDSFVCLLVDVRGELLAVISRPSLLVATLVAAIVGNGFGSIASLGDVLSEMSFANSPPTERGDVGIVGSDCARRPALTSEMPCIFTEMT